MKITRATDLGLRALMVLSRGSDQRTTLAELAARLAVPERHLAKVVQRLAKRGWVTTSRGRGGGITISDVGRNALASQVLEAIEGVRPVIDCHHPPCPLLAEGCRLREALVAAQEAFLERLGRESVESLSRPLFV